MAEKTTTYQIQTPEFKLACVQRILAGEDRRAVARDVGQESWTLLRWMREYENGKQWITSGQRTVPSKRKPAPNGSAPPTSPMVPKVYTEQSNPPELQKSSSELADLRKKVADLTDERDHLKALLARYL